MRLLLATFLCLGISVMILAQLERAVDIAHWSSLIAWADQAGVMQNEQFAQVLRKASWQPSHDRAHRRWVYHIYPGDLVFDKRNSAEKVMAFTRSISFH